MTFEDFDLHPDLLRGVADMGFTEPTEIQADAIPPALEGRDVLAAAETGSGKTAAFLLPIMDALLDGNGGKTRALVISPTRELAAQTLRHYEEIGAHTDLRGVTVMGGVAMGPQDKAFKQGYELIVATPGRLLDHLTNRGKHLDDLQFLVLDEADRMLDMGFLPDIYEIIDFLPRDRQNGLFSATLPRQIVSLADQLLQDPVRINIETQHAPATGISHSVYRVKEKMKRSLLLEMLRRDEMQHVLVFTRTKAEADRLADYLQRNDMQCARIHGDLSQKHRTKALADFREGNQWVMIATDIASRGIDVEDITHVVNFDVPQAPEDYIHRVGRTARASQTGEAVTFCSARDLAHLHAIEAEIGEEIPRRELEGFDYEGTPEDQEPISIADRIAAANKRKNKGGGGGGGKKKGSRGSKGRGRGRGRGRGDS